MAVGGLSAGVAYVDILPNFSKFGAATTAGAKLSKIGAGLTKGLTLPIVGAAAAAGKLAYDFDTAFTRISAVSNASQKDVAKWRGEVLQMAGRTAQAPKELADALYFLASAGLKTNQIMPTLEASAKASAVGLGETSDIAKITSQALNAYSKSGLTATQVTDTLVAAVKAGTAEPQEFATALGRILPIAQNAGISFDQVTASLAQLSNAGLDVNEGVTSMRAAILSLSAPTDVAKETMRDLGVTAGEVRDSLAKRGLIATYRDLNERAVELTGSQRDAIEPLKNVFGNVRALAGVMNLTGQRAKAVDKTFGDVKNSTGALSEAMDKTRESSAFKFQQALAKLQATGIEVGAKLLPVFEKVVGFVGDMADKFSALSPATQDNIIKFGLFAAAAGPVLSVLGGIVKLASGAASALSRVAAAPVPTAPVAGAAKAAPAAGLAGVAAVGVATASVIEFRKQLERPSSESIFAHAARNVVQIRDALDRLIPSEEEQAVAAAHAREATQRLSKNLLSGAASATNLEAKIGQMSETQRGVFRGAMESATRAIQRQRGNLQNLGGQLTQHEKAMFNSNMAARNYKGAMDVLSGALARNAQAHRGVSAGINKAEGDAQSAKAEFGAYKSSIDAIPKSVSTKVTADTSPARATMGAYLAQLNNTTASIVVNARIARGGTAHEGRYIAGPAGREVPITAMTGEFITNEKSTKKYRRVLEYINRDRFHSGGVVGGPTHRVESELSMRGGFGTSVNIEHIDARGAQHGVGQEIGEEIERALRNADRYDASRAGAYSRS